MFIKRCSSVALMLALTACGAPPTAERPPMPTEGEAASAAANPLMLKTLGPATLTPVVADTVGTAANSSPDLAVDGILNTRWRVAAARANARFTAQIGVTNPVPLVNLNLNSSALGIVDGAGYTIWVSTDGVNFTRIGGRRTKAAGAASIDLPAGTMAKFVQVRIQDLPSQHTFGINELAATVDFPAPPPPPGTEPGNVTGLFQYAQLFPTFPQYRLGDRLRYEAVGASTDLAQIALNNLAAEALALPSQVQLRGIATVTRTRDDGSLETLGTVDVLMEQPLDELGVVVGTDPQTGHEVELIWPEVTDGIPGNAIVRVQLAAPPDDLEGDPVNVNFEIQKIGPNGNNATWRGATVGTVVGAPEGGNPVPDPIPGGVTGVFNFQTLFGSIPQYRPDRGRLRFEAVGLPTDPATIALRDLAGEALAAQPAFVFRARGRIVRTSNGALLGQANVEMIQPPDELGVVVGADPATGHEVEIIWPAVTDGIPADPIVRIQLNSAPAGLEQTAINADFTIEKVRRTALGDEVVASWRGVSNNVIVPAPR